MGVSVGRMAGWVECGQVQAGQGLCPVRESSGECKHHVTKTPRHPAESTRIRDEQQNRKKPHEAASSTRIT
jgi:hypothetical protein